MSREKKRVATDGGDDLVSNNPFAALSLGGLPSGPPVPSSPPAPVRIAGDGFGAKETLLLRRLKAGKGGKVVTEISGFSSGDGLRELLKILQQKLATGGAVKGKVLEVQGDRLESVRALLEPMGYRVKGS